MYDIRNVIIKKDVGRKIDKFEEIDLCIKLIKKIISILDDKIEIRYRNERLVKLNY